MWGTIRSWADSVSNKPKGAVEPGEPFEGGILNVAFRELYVTAPTAL